MANRNNRYRKLDFYMTRALIADAVIFLLYLLGAAMGWGILKWIMAVIAVLGSGLAVGYLYLSQEWLKKRSLWMTLGFGAIALCTLVSLICKVPFGPVK